jgi:Family of unknown function (DUF6111)
MIRPVAIALVLFCIPFALYAIYLWGTRNGVLDMSSWRLQVVAWLTIGALCLVIAGVFLTAEFSGAPPHSAYVPAHMENGRLVPGMQR